MRLVLCVALLAGLGLAGCSGDDGKIKIAVIPKGTSHQFWKSVHYGAQKAADELGDVEIIWKGPVRESNTQSQIEVVRTMITRGVDGICLAPNHSESLVEVVKESIEEGIPVVIFDSGLGEGADIVSYVATDNFHGGRLAAKQMAESIDGKGNVILLRYLAGSESTLQREEGFLTELEENYPDITVVSSDKYGEDTTAKAKGAVEQLLQNYGEDLDGIFAVCEPNANGTLEALRSSNLEGKIKFIAFDPSEKLIRALEQDECHGIVLQDPVQMGYDAVMTLVKDIRGESVQKVITTGEYVATPQNMKEQRMAELLEPAQFGE